MVGIIKKLIKLLFLVSEVIVYNPKNKLVKKLKKPTVPAVRGSRLNKVKSHATQQRIVEIPIPKR